MNPTVLLTATSRPAHQGLGILRDIPAAGIAGAALENVKDTLTWEQRPPTPDTVKPYQHYARQPAGSILKHPGTARDVLPAGPFGAQSRASVESAADCLKAYPEGEVARWRLERSEDVYASARREPLGRPFNRGHELPAGLGTEKPFGKALHIQEQEAANATKTIIFPEDAPVADDEADPAAHRMYITSHGAFAPGEQRKRDYDWQGAGVDPATHRFGAPSKGVVLTSSEGVRSALQPDLNGGAAHPAPTSQAYAEHVHLHTDFLGRPRHLGVAPMPSPSGAAAATQQSQQRQRQQQQQQQNEQQVFGKPSVRAAEPCVGELIRGWYALEEQQPDADLGKSLREGWRNTQQSPGKAFGLPSVRTDVRAPPLRTRSVANTMNYGCEPSAGQLLAPPKSVDLGVGEAELLQSWSRQELWGLLLAARVDVSEDEFEQAFGWGAAVRRGSGGGASADSDRCSLDAFMRARHALLAQLIGV